MATAVAAVVFVFLLGFSSARLPLDQPKNDFLSTDHGSVSLPDSNPKTEATIFLPSERPETEPASVVESQPEQTLLTDSKSHKKYEKLVQVSEFQTDSFPLTNVFTLRPVNRRFSRVPFFPIRRGYKCHGRHRHHRRFAGQGQISFGNDMIVAKDQDRGSDPANTGNGQRTKQLTKYSHGGRGFSLTNDDTNRQEMYRMFHARPHFHHHRHNHRHHHGGDEEENRHGHGIIYSIRKFLNF